MNYIKINEYDVANGPGVRVSLWVSGCSIKCKGCHNPETWDFYAGHTWNNYAMNALKKALSADFIQGITFTGGHPLDPNNIEEVYKIIKKIKKEFPNKDIWLYTGYPLTIKDFDKNHSSTFNNIIKNCDVIVDGPFIQGEKDITLKWRGSRNQRVIDVKKTIENEEITLYCD